MQDCTWEFYYPKFCAIVQLLMSEYNGIQSPNEPTVEILDISKQLELVKNMNLSNIIKYYL